MLTLFARCYNYREKYLLISDSYLHAALKLWIVACYCLVTKLCPTLGTPQTVAHQVLLSMGFPRQEYWIGLPFPSPGDLPNPRVEPTSPALQIDSSPLSHHGSHSNYKYLIETLFYQESGDFLLTTAKGFDLNHSQWFQIKKRVGRNEETCH